VIVLTLLLLLLLSAVSSRESLILRTNAGDDTEREPASLESVCYKKGARATTK